MTERVPVLGAGRLVTNIDQAHISWLQEQLLKETGGSLESETIESIFNPVDGLHAGIIGKIEFLRLQAWLGEHRLGEAEVDQLAGDIEEALEESPKDRTVDTLPVHFHRWGKDSRFVLSLADSTGVRSERSAATEAVLKFLELDELPRDIWAPDIRKTTQVWLAFSENAEQAALLTSLGSIIEKTIRHPEEEHFPQSIKLGKIEVPTSKKQLWKSTRRQTYAE